MKHFDPLLWSLPVIWRSPNTSQPNLSHVRNWVRLENESPKFGFLFPKTWSPKTVYLWV